MNIWSSNSSVSMKTMKLRQILATEILLLPCPIITQCCFDGFVVKITPLFSSLVSSFASCVVPEMVAEVGV